MMEPAQAQLTTPDESSAIAENETVLVVDDSKLQRWLLASYLNGWGYDVIQAESGEEAERICRETSPDLVVSDWMMPGMDGLDLCRAYREMRGGRYGYFILLTSKSEKDEVAHGLDEGADDFLSKPVNAAELRARIRAGQRVLCMERQLTETNRIISANLETNERDLIEARKLQQSLVRDRHRQVGDFDVSMLLQPAGHVGGDLVGMFQVSDDEIGVYSIDVSGHGIASALMTARLAAYLSGNTPGQNIAITTGPDGAPRMRPPCEVAATLNSLMLEEMETDLYLTLILARVNLSNGDVTMTQAGHPYPAMQSQDGKVRYLGQGGLPVGLVDNAAFTEFRVSMKPGDRLLFTSDGITECADPDGEQLDEGGLSRMLKRHANATGLALFDAVMWDLAKFAGEDRFGDDVSAVLVEYIGDRRDADS